MRGQVILLGQRAVNRGGAALAVAADLAGATLQIGVADELVTVQRRILDQVGRVQHAGAQGLGREILRGQPVRAFPFDWDLERP